MKVWQVGEVMTADVVTVTEETPYRQIVDVLAGRRISAVPVVDHAGHVVGVVSEADLLQKVEAVGEEAQRRIFAGRRRRDRQSKAGAVLARDLMTAPAITAYEDTPLVAAAKSMDRAGVKRLPVVDDLGRPVGIVTRGDLLKVYLRPDAQIRREVVDEVLHRVLMIEHGTVRVEVTDGVVRLAGRLDRRTSAELAVRLAAQVAGVVDIVDDLGYDFDDRALAGIGAFSVPVA